MGWSSSPGLFSSRVRSILEDTESVTYGDDILIGGATRTEHDVALEQVLDRLDRYGLHLNVTKIQLAKPSVVFLGFDISEGVFGLESYFKQQVDKLPTASTSRQLRKILGVLSVFRPTCEHCERMAQF